MSHEIVTSGGYGPTPEHHDPFGRWNTNPAIIALVAFVAGIGATVVVSFAISCVRPELHLAFDVTPAPRTTVSAMQTSMFSATPTHVSLPYKAGDPWTASFIVANADDASYNGIIVRRETKKLLYYQKLNGGAWENRYFYPSLTGKGWEAGPELPGVSSSPSYSTRDGSTTKLTLTGWTACNGNSILTVAVPASVKSSVKAHKAGLPVWNSTYVPTGSFDGLPSYQTKGGGSQFIAYDPIFSAWGFFTTSSGEEPTAAYYLTVAPSADPAPPTGQYTIGNDVGPAPMVTAEKLAPAKAGAKTSTVTHKK